MGSFNKAAEDLYISPPAVIKQINAVESELEVSLFIRTHRGLVLTDAGKSFYKRRYISASIFQRLGRAGASWRRKKMTIFFEKLVHHP